MHHECDCVDPVSSPVFGLNSKFLSKTELKFPSSFLYYFSAKLEQDADDEINAFNCHYNLVHTPLKSI